MSKYIKWGLIIVGGFLVLHLLRSGGISGLANSY